MTPGGKLGPRCHHIRPHRHFVWGNKPPKARGHGSRGTRVPMVTMPHGSHACRARNECRRPGCGPPCYKRTAAIELGRPCRHHRYRVCRCTRLAFNLSTTISQCRGISRGWAPLGGAPSSRRAERNDRRPRAPTKPIPAATARVMRFDCRHPFATRRATSRATACGVQAAFRAAVTSSRRAERIQFRPRPPTKPIPAATERTARFDCGNPFATRRVKRTRRRAV